MNKRTFLKKPDRLLVPGEKFPWILLAVLVLAALTCNPVLHAQTTGQLTGLVEDTSGGVIPAAQVTLTNEATGDTLVSQTNSVGQYSFPALRPGTYSVKVVATGFQPKQVTGIILHAGAQINVPSFVLSVGTATETVQVQSAPSIIPTNDGERSAVLDYKQIQNLALQGRDVTELLKVLPGVTTQSGGLTQASPMYSDLNITVNQSAIGNGLNINGVVNRGGTALLADGANVIDPGNMASSVVMINPEMTQEVTVQASNFGAEIPFGPVVVSTISKSGTSNYHGEAYFDARNNVLDANDSQDNHQGISQGPAHYYYPGGNFGGPVPGTHKKLLFWGGYERMLQNQGNANHLTSFIPSPEMMAGDFTTDNADNNVLCPNGFSGTKANGKWCNDLSGTIYPDGSSSAASASLPGYNATTGYDNGQKVPSQFLDPGAAALAKIWPKANANPATTPGGFNYFQPIENINNGWLYRVRIDYNLSDSTKIYGSYQQAFNSELAQGNGAHLYWTPGNAIPFPGGGEVQVFRGKALSGHFIHTFGPTATNDFMAAWAFGSFPFTTPNPSAAYRSTLGYPYGKVFPTASLNIPAYSSAGPQTFPDFSQASIFENPPGQYAVRKEAPQFNDVFTKVWGAHTVKMGAYTQNTDNYQSTFATYQDGDITSFSGQNPNIITGNALGSQNNPVANFEMGIATGYNENNSSPIADTAYQATAAFVDDTWRATRRLTLEVGARVEHVGHWYDRDHIGMAVFYPQRVLPDYQAGKYAPGYYWHAIDAGVPLSGQPNRFAYFDPRFGLSYDVFGTGNTIVRGGWGAYRFVTQVNDVASSLVTAQHVLGYSLPGGNSVQLSQISDLAYKPCTAQCPSGSQSGFDPSDYSQPLTFAYNFTIDQRLPWNSVLDIAYVGNSTSQLSDDSEGIEGSNFSALADQNKTPMGALFKPDPVTGVLSDNPEKVSQNTDGTMTGNSYADYHPYGAAYGTNAAYMIQGIAYTNYNGLQVAWVKTAGRLTFNFNGTWSKTLGTSLQADPFNVNYNYGPTSIDRPFVFNSSYTYQSGELHTGSRFLNGLAGGWTISGISTWQAGGYIPSLLGNGVPNFGLSETYVNVPANLSANGVTTGIGARTYFGTDAPVPILPVLTCDPTQNLAKYQRLQLKCFSAPPVGQNGGHNYPYMSMGSYFNNDLALYKSFHIHESQQVQFRISAFNWLNHPLPEFSAQNQVNLYYLVDYPSKTITLNQGPGATVTNWGFMDTKSQAPYQRILELNVKYSF